MPIDWSLAQNFPKPADFFASYQQGVQTAQQQQAVQMQRAYLSQAAQALASGDPVKAAEFKSLLESDGAKTLAGIPGQQATTQGTQIANTNLLNVDRGYLAHGYMTALQSGGPDAARSYLTNNHDALISTGFNDDQIQHAIANPTDPAVLGTVQAMIDSAYSPNDQAKNANEAVTAQAAATSANANALKESYVVLQPGETGKLIPGSAAAAAGGASTSVPAAPAAAGAAPTGADEVIANSIVNEGGWNPRDANGTPTNWGINWKANAPTLQAMGFNPQTFQNMTRDQAVQIYKQNYWDQSGAANLPPNLQAPYFDVYIRSPGRAKAWLAQATQNGQVNPSTFMQLANSGFQRLAQSPKYAMYQHSWAVRDGDNSAIANAGTSGPVGAQVTSAVLPAGASAQLTPAIAAAGSTPAATPAAAPGDLTSGPAFRQTTDPSGNPIQIGPDGKQEPAVAPLGANAIEGASKNWAIDPGSAGSGGMGGGAARTNQIQNYTYQQLLPRYNLTPDALPAIRNQFAIDKTNVRNRLTQHSNMMKALDSVALAGNTVLGYLKDAPGNTNNAYANEAANSLTRNFAQKSAGGVAQSQLGGSIALLEKEMGNAASMLPGGGGQATEGMRKDLSILSDPSESTYSKRVAIHSMFNTLKQAVEGDDMAAKEAQQRIAGRFDAYANWYKSQHGGGQSAPANAGGSIPTLGPAEAAKLPPGTKFRGTDGVVRVKH